VRRSQRTERIMESSKKVARAARRPRLLAGAAVSVLIAALNLAVAAAPANAAAACAAGAASGQFSPGLHLVAEVQNSFNFTVTVAACATSNPNITSLHMVSRARGAMSCTTGTMNGTGNIDWGVLNQEELHSTVEYVLTHALSGWVFTGTVKSGEFAGESFQMVFPAGGANPLECLSQNGLENFTAQAEVVII
jgi:hypothetical protein